MVDSLATCVAKGKLEADPCAAIVGASTLQHDQGPQVALELALGLWEGPQYPPRVNDCVVIAPQSQADATDDCLT
eukprot:7315393-Alexandrium_andersonii.AAC.1